MINSERLVKNFIEYVQIDSETGNEGAMMELLLQKLKALGCAVKTDGAGKKVGSNGDNIYAFYKGTLPGEPLIFSAHMDTVKPGNGIRPLVKEGVISSSGATILGADDKSGIAGILEALTVIHEKGLPCRDVEIIFSIQEESGMLGAGNFDFGQTVGNQAVVLDGGGDVGTITTSAPGELILNAAIIGKSSHAGSAPEQGISSIQVAARGVAAMKLLRIDEETTCNIGTFKSEGANNIVPARTEISAEIRSRNLDKLNAQAEHMCGCLQKACNDAGAKLECTLTTAYVSFQIADDNPLVQHVEQACAAIGRRSVIRPGGGGSDANIMNALGMNAIVLGTGMNKVHTTQENISVKNLEDTARLVLALMTD